MKYVILKTFVSNDPDTTRVYPFIFPDYVVHKHVADSMLHMLGMKEEVDARVLSAGHCTIDNSDYSRGLGSYGKWICAAGSESMQLRGTTKDGLRDAMVLNMPNAMQGIVLDGSCDV